MDRSELIVMLLGFFVGSGLVTKKAGPFLFFYIVAPLLSAIAMVFVLEQIPIPGFDFEYDKYLGIVFHRQGDLVRSLSIGLGSGFALMWISRRLFLTKEREKRGRRALVDPKVSMQRKKRLRTLGLNNSAGPRDILMAWTKLSTELRDPNWDQQTRNRNTGITAEDRKKAIDEAYAWLKSNSDEASQDRSKRPTSALRSPWWKRFLTRFTQKKVRIRDV
ncbi:MAG: hypothetical protein AAGF33_12480 [Pseudomonadota bacterium]